MTEGVKVPSDTLSFGKVFASFPQALGGNVFVDTTDIVLDPKNPANLNEVPLVGSSTRQDVIGNFAYRRGLSYDLTGPHTFVFWKRPDPQKLLDMVLAEQKRIDAEFPPPDRQKAVAAVKDFYAARYNWNKAPKTLADIEKASEGVEGELQWSDFPPELSQVLQGEFYRQIGNDVRAPSYQSFDVSYWQDARVTLRPVSGALPWGGRVKNAPVIMVTPPRAKSAIKIQLLVGALHFQQAAWKARPISKTSVCPAGDTGAPVSDTNAPVASELKANPALQVPVDFQTSKSTLANLVADLKKRTKVELQVAPELEGRTLIAYSSPMSLSEAMQSLGRLYSAHWVKTNTTYTLTPDETSEMALSLARMGTSAYYGYGPWVKGGRGEFGASLADEIYGALDTEQLKSPQGAAFSELPADLQSRLVQLHRGDKMGSMFIWQQRVNDTLAAGVRVRFAPVAPKTVTFFGTARTQPADFGLLGPDRSGLGVYTTDGRFVVPVLRDWIAEPPSPILKEIQERRKADQKWAREHWQGPGQPPDVGDEPNTDAQPDGADKE